MTHPAEGTTLKQVVKTLFGGEENIPSNAMFVCLTNNPENPSVSWYDYLDEVYETHRDKIISEFEYDLSKKYLIAIIKEEK